jgi:hypothetical protein
MSHPKKSESHGGTRLAQNEKTNKTQMDSMLEITSMADDWARITPVFSVQFSMKKGLLNCEWQPYLPTPEQLGKLAGSQAYFDARHRFVLRLSSQLKINIMVLDGGAK